jgi:hypothetical protein
MAIFANFTEKCYTGEFGLDAELALCALPAQNEFVEVAWRGVRVAEGARLESVFTRNRDVGSNPTLSAS